MLYQHLEYQKIGRVTVINIFGPLDDREGLARLADELNDVCIEAIADGESLI